MCVKIRVGCFSFKSKDETRRLEVESCVSVSDGPRLRPPKSLKVKHVCIRVAQSRYYSRINVLVGEGYDALAFCQKR